MIIIKYYDGKTTIEVEVTEEFAEAYKVLQRETYKINKRKSRNENVSLNHMETENGYQFVDLYSDDLLVAMIKREDHEELIAKLKEVIKELTPKQKVFIKMLYQELSLREIATKLNLSKQAVSRMRKRIQKKTKKYFEKKG